MEVDAARTLIAKVNFAFRMSARRRRAKTRFETDSRLEPVSVSCSTMTMRWQAAA